MEASSSEAATRETLGADSAWHLSWVAETGSTNAELLEAARGGAPPGQVLVADHQTAGRGRLGRRWEAPPRASLLVSILLRPALQPASAHLGAIAVALSAADACEELAGVRPGLKWPNDLVVERPEGTRKLGGVLSESILEGGELSALVVGIGLNVNWPEELPPELTEIATALSYEAGPAAGRAGTSQIDRVALLAGMLDRLAERALLLDTAGGRREVLEDLRSRCVTLGQQVRAELPDATVTGQAVAVTDEGHLVVASDDGTRHEIAAGDVIHLRPTPGGVR